MSRRHPEPRRRRSTITIPTGVGPHVKLVFAEMRRQGKTYDVIEERSGVLRSTLKAWRSKNAPGLESMSAVLGALGFDFLPIPRAAVLPPRLRDALLAVGKEHDQALDVAIQQWVAIVAGVHERVANPPPIRSQRKTREPAESGVMIRRRPPPRVHVNQIEMVLH